MGLYHFQMPLESHVEEVSDQYIDIFTIELTWKFTDILIGICTTILANAHTRMSQWVEENDGQCGHSPRVG